MKSNSASTQIYRPKNDSDSKKVIDIKKNSYLLRNENLDIFEKVSTNKEIKEFASSSFKISKEQERKEYVEYQINKLRNLIVYENIESGMENDSEKYFRQLMDENSLLAQEIISKLFYKTFGSDNNSKEILIGILNLISHLEIDSKYATIKIIAVAAIAHKDDDVKDYAVQCFENWEDYNDIGALCNINTQANWLKKYVKKVIENLTILKEEVGGE